MSSRECKFCRAVVERRRLPGRRRVASLAILTEVPRNVIRIRGAGEIRCMALVAVAVDQRIVVVRMARLARSRLMSSCQGEFCRAVIEGSSIPRRRRVTENAVRRKAAGPVIWIRR